MSSMSPSPTTPPSLALGPSAPIRRIVVPVVGSVGHDRGVDVALEWARHFGLPMVLLTVDTSGGEELAVDVALGEHLVRTRERIADATGLQVGERVVAGSDPVAAVAAEVADGDLVIMSSSGSLVAPARSHGWQLVQALGRPVLLVGPAVRNGHLDGPVAVGLDGSPLAEQALPIALSLAGTLDSSLWLVQAVPAAAVAQVERLREQGQQVSASAYLRSVADQVANGAWDELGQHLTDHDLGLPATDDSAVEGEPVAAPPSGDRTPGWEVIQSDDAPVALSQFALDRRASVLVLSTHGRSGLRPDALGSTCLATVATASAPVLVLRPSGTDEAALTP